MLIRLATCRPLPEPDPDEVLLTEELLRRGLNPLLLAWDDPEAPWDEEAPTLLRSTWNYYHRPEEFLRWAERVSLRGPLWNPLPVVRWNLHKRYLLDLAARGVPVTPTVCLLQGADLLLGDLMRERGWEEVVIKPAVSAASFRTRRFTRATLEEGEAHLASLLKERDTLVQQYLPSVEEYGERSLVFIEGAITHAIRKAPRLVGQEESVQGPVPIAAEERALAEAALRAVEAPEGALLYARCDMARDLFGAPVIMELELMEPSLFFLQGEEALRRMGDAVHARVAAFFREGPG